MCDLLWRPAALAATGPPQQVTLPSPVTLPAPPQGYTQRSLFKPPPSPTRFIFCFVAFRCCVVLHLVRTCFALFSNIACMYMYMYIAGADTYRTLAVQSHGSASNSECRFYTVPSSCQLYSHLLTHLRRCLAKDTSTHQPLMTLSRLVSHCSSTRWSAVARKVMVVVHWRRYMSQAPAPLARSFITQRV